MKPPAGCGYPPSGLIRRSLRALARAEFTRMLGRERVVGAVDHPLDFVCIPLVRTRRSGVCGHIWIGSRGSRTIHAHSWQLYSEVVHGAMANEVFRVVGHADGEYSVVHVHSENLTDRMTSTGTNVHVDGKVAEVCREGGAYTLGVNTFHRSTPVGDGPVMTLVRATVFAGCHDRVLVRSPSSDGTVRRRRLPEDRALALVAMFRNAIDDGGPTAAPNAVTARRPPNRSRAPDHPLSAD